MTLLGHIRQITRYPVKSMGGLAVNSAELGWHGLAGDRRFAFRRTDEHRGFPWLSASRLPQLLLYSPEGLDEASGEPFPTHVRTPAGSSLRLGGTELNADVSNRLGNRVELMMLKHGIFDEGAISLISTATISGICSNAGIETDPRRFRANIVLDTDYTDLFHEDDWVGGTLVFGEGDSCPAVAVTMRDPRCMMVNLDPDSAAQDPRVMKTIVRLNDNNAGVYATVVRAGTVRTGDPVHLLPPSDGMSLVR